MTIIKICGLTTLQDAIDAVRAGADMLGLNFYEPSPRYVRPMRAEQMALGLRQVLGDRCPLLIGLFVNTSPADILPLIEMVGLDAVQLSGDESPADLAALSGLAIKAIRPRDREEALNLVDACLPHAPDNDVLPSLILDAYHPDLYGGTGDQASVEVALAVRERVPRLMLAGGLTPDNIAERVAAIQPWGVDVASGIEGSVKGRKDVVKMQAFTTAIRG